MTPLDIVEQKATLQGCVATARNAPPGGACARARVAGAQSGECDDPSDVPERRPARAATAALAVCHGRGYDALLRACVRGGGWAQAGARAPHVPRGAGRNGAADGRAAIVSKARQRLLPGQHQKGGSWCAHARARRTALRRARGPGTPYQRDECAPNTQVLADVKKQEKDLRAQKDAAQLALENMVGIHTRALYHTPAPPLPHTHTHSPVPRLGRCRRPCVCSRALVCTRTHTRTHTHSRARSLSFPLSLSLSLSLTIKTSCHHTQTHRWTG
jgi:hypothetical protein